jgi:hypothetical protein
MFNWLWRLLNGLAKSQRSLKAWGDQKWTTKSENRRPKQENGTCQKRQYKSLSPQEYAATTTSKTSGKSAGEAVCAPASKSKSKSKTVSERLNNASYYRLMPLQEFLLLI